MVTINPLDYEKILTAVGYPVVKQEDLEYTQEDVMNFIISPVVRKYFSWFPKTEQVSNYIGIGPFEFVFPDAETFSVVDIRFNDGVHIIPGRSGNPFVDAISYRVADHGMYGTRYEYGMEAANLGTRAYDVSRMNNIRAVRYDVDQNARKVTGYSNDLGELLITWAKMSNNFNDIPVNRKDEVIELCQAELMRSLALLRGQMNANTGVTFNVEAMKLAADDKETKVLTKWKAISKVSIARS